MDRPKMWEKQIEAMRFTVKRKDQGTALFMEMGCVSGSAKVHINRAGKGKMFSLRDAFEKFNGLAKHPWDANIPTSCRALVDGELRQHRVRAILSKGVKPVLEITTENGRKLRLTADHEVLTPEGRWVEAQNLVFGDVILTNGTYNCACPECGGTRKLKRPTRRLCPTCAYKNRNQAGEANPNFKKGKFIDRDGYVRVTGKQGHPREQGESGQVYEHILVMESHLKRAIRPEEHVHHLNMNRTDNRIENLKVLGVTAHGKVHADHTRLQGGNVWFVPEEDRIKSVLPCGEEEVYDIVMDDPHRNFVANGIIVHNCGKTRVMIESLARLSKTEKLRLILIIAPLSVLTIWPDEWGKWVDEPTLFIDLHDCGPAGLRRARRMAKEGATVICLLNFESTWQLGHERVYKEKKMPDGTVVKKRLLKPNDTILTDIPFDACIIDEATGIKNPSAQVTKFLLKLSRYVRWKWVLTGSAYIKRPLDVYCLLKFISGTRYVPATYTAFKAEYAIPHPSIPGAVLGYRNLNKLVKIMTKCCVLLKKEDVLDLPPALDLPHLWVQMPEKAKKVYEDVRADMYAELEEIEANGGTVTINHVLAKQAKLAQIASGFVKNDDGTIIELHSEIVSEIIRILEERDGKPTVIVVHSNHMEIMLSRAIQKAFKFTPKILNGAVTTADERFEMCKAASKDPAFIVKEKVGAKGMDMRFADLTIWAEVRADTDNYVQMRSRTHRGGQTKKVAYLHILTKCPTHRRIMQILKGDVDLSKSIEGMWRKLL